jgi:FMN-dependent NADH-azoreductase
MSKTLHIEASPRGSDSGSSQLAAWFLSAYREKNPDELIETLNVFEVDLPPVNADAIHAKFAPIFNEEVNDAQRATWRDVEAQIAFFDSFDKIVLSSPMWNYSIPYPLKHYFDIIMQPRLTFGYNSETMEHIGLLRNRPVQLLLTRSSVPPGDYSDFQLPYLRFVFGAMGLRDIRVILAWHTTQPTAEARAEYLESFNSECTANGSAF